MSRAVAQYIAQTSFAAALPEEVYPFVHLRHYAPGTLLMAQGEEVSQFLMITEGRARVRSLSEEGRSLVVDYLTAPAISGDIELLNHCPSLYSVIAIDTVCALTVPAELFFSVLMTHPPFLSLLCYTFAAKLRVTSGRHSSSSLYPLSYQLAQYLSYELAANGELRRLPMNEAAQYLGVTARHLRRVLAQWESEGILRRERGMVAVVDQNRFAALCSAGDDMN